MTQLKVFLKGEWKEFKNGRILKLNCEIREKL